MRKVGIGHWAGQQGLLTCLFTIYDVHILEGRFGPYAESAEMSTGSELEYIEVRYVV